MVKNKKPRSLFLIAFALVMVLFAFRHCGRSVWQPLKLKFEGKRTVSEVLMELESEMFLRFVDLESLTDGQAIALIAFKDEKILELWKQKGKRWTFVKEYPFSAYSGNLGPKTKEGDLQIPEGVYKIEYLNPNSAYYLSLKVDYPNAFDRAKARGDKRTQLGGDIFIHGMFVTIGCIPVGNENVEEIFYLVAKNGYPNTKVIISPYDMRAKLKTLEIESVTWEKELYDAIAIELDDFRRSR